MAIGKAFVKVHGEAGMSLNVFHKLRENIRMDGTQIPSGGVILSQLLCGRR